jgi:hypothetical protein
MNEADISRIDAAARQGFGYQPDPSDRDEWRSHADDVLAGRTWFGDCDDLASTVLDLAGREGLPLSSRFRLMVTSPGGKPPYDHMLGAIMDETGAYWTAGDTFGPASPAAQCPHRAFCYHRMDEWTADGEPVWRTGFPWAVA